ncbi:PRTRC system protein E [Methylibium sp.]|uniref:PRTRC system protein E n=1 Tax=Methylibium sp. TaxID=2067992 RepID=UPI003D1226F5
MTMFEELFALAASATLTMTVSANEATGRMTINVIPKPRKDVNEPALTQPLSLTATPQEFDAGFIAALSGYREVRQTLEQQAEATNVVIEAAKAASVKKACDATSKAAGSAKPGGAASMPLPAASAARLSAPAAVDPDEPDEETSSTAAAPTTAPDVRAPAAAGGDSYDLFG